MRHNFFIAADSEFLGYDSATWPENDWVDSKTIGVFEAASVLSMLRSSGDPFDVIEEFALLTDESADQYVLGVPEDFASKMAAFSADRIDTIASTFADATPDLGWTADDFKLWIRAMMPLAQRAKDQSKTMYLWMTK